MDNQGSEVRDYRITLKWIQGLMESEAIVNWKPIAEEIERVLTMSVEERVNIVTYRRFLPEKEYVDSFLEKGEAVPPFLAFQPHEVRNNIAGYMVPCKPDHPDAERYG